MARSIDWTQYDQLKAHGLSDREIARQWGIPWGIFHRETQQRTEQGSLMLPAPEPHETQQGGTPWVPAKGPHQESISPVCSAK